MMIMYHVEDVSISIISMKSLNNKHSRGKNDNEKNWKLTSSFQSRGCVPLMDESN